MNTLKSLVVFAVLGVIGYAVYLGLGGQLNVSVGLPSDLDISSDRWNSNGAESHDSMASHHDEQEHEHHHRGHDDSHDDNHNGDHDGNHERHASSPTEKSTAAPAAYRQEIKPAPYANTTTIDPAPSGVARSDSTASDPAPTAKSTTASVPSTGPSAYRSQTAGSASTTTSTKPRAPAGSLDARRPASKIGARAVGASYVFESQMKEARQKIDSGHPEDSLFSLSQLYENTQLSGEQRQRLLALLDQVAGTVIYSREHLMEPAYIVKTNERLADIAVAYNVSPGLLAKINGISEAAPLQPGSSLKVIRGPFNAVINTTSRELTLFVKNGRYAGRFPIHIGSEFPLKTGSGTLIGKTRQHSQYENHAWIGLGSSPDLGKPTGGPTVAAQEFGIVGMKDPTAVDTGPSRRNIGVSPSHADDLYDILSQKSTITVMR